MQSDPLKVADFRAVQRYRSACVEAKACHMQDAAFANFSRLLLKVRRPHACMHAVLCCAVLCSAVTALCCTL